MKEFGTLFRWFWLYGGMAGLVYGGRDGLLYALISFVVIDYLTV